VAILALNWLKIELRKYRRCAIARAELAELGDRRLQAKIPYVPEDPLLVAHIEEILAQPQVDCRDYVGERLITGGSTNSIQQ